MNKKFINGLQIKDTSTFLRAGARREWKWGNSPPRLFGVFSRVSSDLDTGFFFVEKRTTYVVCL